MAQLEKEIDPVKGFTTVCQYCNAQYLFSPEDIAKLREEIQRNQQAQEQQPEESSTKIAS